MTGPTRRSATTTAQVGARSQRLYRTLNSYLFLLVKSNQELHETALVDLESAQVTYDAQIADLEAANEAKQRRIDELEERQFFQQRPGRANGGVENA